VFSLSVASNAREESPIANEELLINEEIRAREVRLVGDDNAQLGIMSSREALAIAEEKGLDLVLIAAKSTPPVCKLMDYGKFKYEASKHKKEQRKKQHVISVKELRMGPHIEEHDLNVRVNQGRSFLQSGDKVKVAVRFRGREMAHQNLGKDILERIKTMLEDVAVVEKQPLMEGRSMIMVLAPKNDK